MKCAKCLLSAITNLVFKLFYMYTPVIKAILRIGCNKYSGEIGMCTSVNRGAILNTGCFPWTDAGLTRQISIASLCVTVANGL